MRTGIAILGIFITALLSLLPADSLASDHFTEGKRLFKAGDYQQAYTELEQAFRESPENLDISFALGRTAFELGDYEGAVAAFERILTVEPRAPRVKLELARSYLKLGSTEVAKGYFHDVLETNPPPAVKQNIQYFLASIGEAERRHFLSGLVEVGLLYDDNVGVFPNSDTVIIGGLPVTLEGNQEKDAGLQLSAVLNHMYRMGTSPYSWRSSLTTYNRLYQDISEEDINYLGVATGLARQTDQTLWELKVNAGQVNRDSDKYLDLLGVSLSHFCSIKQNLFLNLSIGFQDKDYEDSDEQDARAWSAVINPVLDVGMNRFSVTAGLEKEDADADFYSYDRAIAGLRYERVLPRDFRFYGSFRYQMTDYEDEMPLFGTKREDDQYQFEAGVTKTLWRSQDRRQSLSAKVSHSYTDARSNIDIYEYDKNVTLTTLMMTF